MPLCGLTEPSSWPNSCNLNCYADGSDGIDWHADDEALFQSKEEDCCIISLSLGEVRTFQIRRESASEQEQSISLRLGAGDLCTMEGHFQRYYVHRVPKSQTSRLRVNFTWRWIVAHDARCSQRR